MTSLVWEYELQPNRAIYPSQTFCNALSNFLSKQQPPDLGFIFKFPNSSQTITIHVSRLVFAQGPLAALTTRDFRERCLHEVYLSEEDDVTTFLFLRDYLYGKRISLENIESEFDAYIKVIKAAHRWALMPLFDVLCHFLHQDKLLADASNVIQAATVVEMPGVPEELLNYFWESVAEYYEVFSPQVEDDNSHCGVEEDAHVNEQGGTVRGAELQSPGHEHVNETNGENTSDDAPEQTPFADLATQLNPLLPNLWQLAVAQGKVYSLISRIQYYPSHPLNEQLVLMLIHCLEPIMSDDEELFRALEILGPDTMRREILLDPKKIANCSGRAVQLLSKSLLVSTKLRDEMQANWQISLRQISPYRRLFIFGPATSANHNYGYTDNAWEVGPFNANSAVQISVDTRLRGERTIAVTVKWIVGVCVPHKNRKINVVLRILENPCSCGRADNAVTDVLAEWSFLGRLSERSMLFEEEYNDDECDVPVAAHACCECTATVLVKAHLSEL